jgi:hypothetical protein
MRCGGTEAPRRKVGVGGYLMRWAQSSGEWPGERRTFFEGREKGERVEVEGAREDVRGPRDRDGGPRRVEAAEGGGRRFDEGLGGALRVEVVDGGREGGGMSVWEAVAGFRLEFGFERAGGGMRGRLGCCFCCGRDAAIFSITISLSSGIACPSILALSSSSRVKDGIGSPSVVRACAFGVVCGDALFSFPSIRLAAGLDKKLCFSVTGSPACFASLSRCCGFSV